MPHRVFQNIISPIIADSAFHARGLLTNHRDESSPDPNSIQYHMCEMVTVTVV